MNIFYIACGIFVGGIGIGMAAILIAFAIGMYKNMKE